MFKLQSGFTVHCFQVSELLVPATTSFLQCNSLVMKCSCFAIAGDKLVITEQTLDQKDFYVVNTRTTSQGRVPTEFVKIGE